MTMRWTLGAAALVLSASAAWAQAAPAPKPAAAAKLSEHVQKDIERHRAMAAAHEAAAKCLESGRDEEKCQADLAASCKGLAIGKYCGMRHEH